MSLLHRRSDDGSQHSPAGAPPPAAPAPAAPPSAAELDALHELRLLRDQLEDGTLTQAEFDERRKRLGV